MWIVGRARGLVEGAEETASGWWGKKGRVRAVVAVRWLWQASRQARGGVDYHTSQHLAGRSGAETVCRAFVHELCS